MVAITSGVAVLVGAVLGNAVEAERRATRLDPRWPPVLIAFVVIVLAAIAVMIVLFVRSLRARAGERGGAR